MSWLLNKLISSGNYLFYDGSNQECFYCFFLNNQLNSEQNFIFI